MVENREKMRDAIIQTPCLSPASTNHCLLLLYLLHDAPEGKPPVSSLRRGWPGPPHRTNAQRLDVTVCESLWVVKVLTAFRPPQVMSAAQIYHSLRGNTLPLGDKAASASVTVTGDGGEGGPSAPFAYLLPACLRSSSIGCMEIECLIDWLNLSRRRSPHAARRREGSDGCVSQQRHLHLEEFAKTETIRGRKHVDKKTVLLKREN